MSFRFLSKSWTRVGEMKQIVLESRSLEDTAKIAALVLKELPRNSIGLSGKLGAGKTEFVRSLARELGVKEQITSPTYTFEYEYELPGSGRFSMLHHWDLYRAGDKHFIQEISELLSDPKILVVIEWPEQVPAIADLLCTSILIDSPALSAVERDENYAFFDDCRRIFKIFSRV